MANKLVVEQVDLLALSDQPERYRFTMIDNEHDGLSPGYYQVWLGPEEEDTILFEGGVFFLEDVHIFEIPPLPSPSPTRSPSSNGFSLYIHNISYCAACFLLGDVTVRCVWRSFLRNVIVHYFICKPINCRRYQIVGNSLYYKQLTIYGRQHIVMKWVRRGIRSLWNQCVPPVGPDYIGSE
jgi:hypothetical protein